LIAALLYQDFIKQFIEIQDKRTRLRELISQVTTALPDIIISQALQDESKHGELLELQLKRDQELEGQDEDKRYQTIKQITMPIIQKHIQRLTKDSKISSETKQEILNLTKKI